jgi:hypothetical protein
MSGLRNRPRFWTDRVNLLLPVAALALALGCDGQPPAPPDPGANRGDPRSPRVKKRDALYPPEATTKAVRGGTQ